MEAQFNTGKYRGALFHLNFQANEKQRYLKKIRKHQTNSRILRNSESAGKIFAQQSQVLTSITKLLTNEEVRNRVSGN